MTWTYMLGLDWTGWTAISDGPTTLAPLRAVLIMDSTKTDVMKKIKESKDDNQGGYEQLS